MLSEAAFEVLFRANYTRFVSVSYSYTKQRQVAEEVVQDVFVDFWRRIQNNEKILNNEAYLRRAIVYRSLDIVKKERKHSEKENVELLDQLISMSEPNPEEKIINREKYNHLQEQIDSLPEKTRIVFIMSRFEKMSYQEISEHYDISVKTVEYHISKALSSLRNALLIGVLALFYIFL